MSGGGSSLRRIGAMILRYWYLLRGSWPRIVELIYWPTLQVVLWGLITEHLLTNSDWVSRAAGVLIAAVLLWDTMFRAQLGVSIGFLEEMWSRNMGHLFVSPLRPGEWVVSLMAMSLVRTLIGIVPAALLAIPLYDYSIFAMGPALLAFFGNLMLTGWAIALIVVSLVLRWGMGAETLVWAIIFLLAPVSAVYYPIEVLPEPFQWLAQALPPAHVFEGMRSVLFDGVFDSGRFFAALGLNAVLMAIGASVFLAAFQGARRRGALLQQGE